MQIPSLLLPLHLASLTLAHGYVKWVGVDNTLYVPRSYKENDWIMTDSTPDIPASIRTCSTSALPNVTTPIHTRTY
jgi:hypothetical protein